VEEEMEEESVKAECPCKDHSGIQLRNKRLMFRTIPQSYNNSLGSRLQHMSRRQRLTRIAIVP
jgi:hypothetical protein